MKNSKKMFILIEAVLAVMVILMVCMMLLGKNGENRKKISVIVSNSDDNQWSAFKYGLKMAAEDTGMEVFVVSTDGYLTVQDEENLIENEIDNGAAAVIVQPVAEEGFQSMIKKIEKKIPVMLVETDMSQDKKKASDFPVTEADHYEMGKTMSKELLKDYAESLNGKTMGILMETDGSEASQNREKGLMDGLKGTGVDIRWTIREPVAGKEENLLKSKPKVDIVVALDDTSLTSAGECAAATDLKGAVVYGIGNSTEAMYYLDTGIVECVVVPDEFNVGYKSFTEASKKLKRFFYEMRDQMISHTVVRRDTLFIKENQELLFTMSQ